MRGEYVKFTDVQTGEVILFWDDLPLDEQQQTEKLAG